jgi:hypothetical protein
MVFSSSVLKCVGKVLALFGYLCRLQVLRSAGESGEWDAIGTYGTGEWGSVYFRGFLFFVFQEGNGILKERKSIFWATILFSAT